MEPADLLAAHDAQVRDHVPSRLPDGLAVERVGPLRRFASFASGGFIGYRDLAGLDGDELDELIAQQIEFFRARDESFEWKTYAHDEPADLPERLRRFGFVAGERETVVIAALDDVPLDAQPPEGVTIREVTARSDLDRIAALHRAVWEDDLEIADDLERELAADPDGLVVAVAEAAGEVVCAAWMRYSEGTEFASFFGGSTLEAWRRRGIYRALVAWRARRAAERGVRFLQVDASEDSRPILQRLGFVAVTTTTPYIWSPPG